MNGIKNKEDINIAYKKEIKAKFCFNFVIKNVFKILTSLNLLKVIIPQ